MQNSYRLCIPVKGHQESSPGGHDFSFLYVSINNKPNFFSEVVVNKKAPGSYVEPGAGLKTKSNQRYLSINLLT